MEQFVAGLISGIVIGITLCIFWSELFSKQEKNDYIRFTTKYLKQIRKNEEAWKSYIEWLDKQK